MRNSAGLEGLSDHFLGDLCQCRLDPTEKKISAWRLVLASWNSNDPDIIHAKYFRQTLSLKGLLRHLSKGCKTGVRPPGIIVTSMFCWFRSPFTESVKWAQNESHTRRECSPRGKLCLIHSLRPCSSIQPFLWKETRRGSGTTRSLGVRTSLKMTFGGTFFPSAATARTTVKLQFSALQDFTGTVWLPLNSDVRFDGSSKCTRCLIHIVDVG